jgi:transglutaminase-like putative cysteine protease
MTPLTFTMTHLNRRQWLTAASLASLPGLPTLALAAEPQQRSFNPQPGQWRTLEITTRVELVQAQGNTRVWLPMPSINTDYQQSLDNAWTGNATRLQQASDAQYGAKMLVADFTPDTATPFVELSSRIRTQNRAVDWSATSAVKENAATQKYWLHATDLIPTDGIVQQTAKTITQGAKTDVEKARKLFDWVVSNTYREPKVRGCGVGDIKAMLETGNMGGKCGDINALFVGLCRAVGVPARDVYGIRMVPSAFGYKELSGNPTNLTRAQHCRAEVYLAQHGWVAMDPADVGKVMRLETPEWLKTTQHPVVAPVNQALFGGWEGNWLAFNNAADVALPGAQGPKIGFFMYPVAEDANGRLDSLDPDQFKYVITSKEIAA